MAQSTTTEIRDALAAANERSMAAFNRGDAVGVAAAYTANGQILPPNNDVIAGQQGIQTLVKGEKCSIRESTWSFGSTKPANGSYTGTSGTAAGRCQGRRSAQYLP